MIQPLKRRIRLFNHWMELCAEKQTQFCTLSQTNCVIINRDNSLLKLYEYYNFSYHLYWGCNIT